MIERALYNPTKAPIVDYPIEDLKVDDEGNLVIDSQTNEPIGLLGTTLWSLDAEETAIFPRYVADILQDRYGFLVESIIPKKEEKKEIEDKTKKDVKKDASND